MYKIALILIVSLLSFNLYGQNEKFKIYTKDDGLLSGNISDLVQDTNGFLWIGTHIGLQRFDGYNFKQYLENPDEEGSINSNDISDLYIDSKNRLMISTAGGFCTYNNETDDFSPFSKYKKANGKKIIEDKLGNYYFLTAAKTCYVTDSNFKEIGIIGGNIEDSYIDNVSPDNIFSDGNGDIWLTQRKKKGITYFDPVTKKKKYITHDPSSSYSTVNAPVHFVYTNDENQVILSGNGGVCVINPENRSFLPAPIQLPNGHKRTSGIVQDPLKRYWVTNQGAGIISYDPKTGVSTRYQPNEYDPSSLHEGNYNSVFSDSEGNIWTYGANTNLNLKFRDLKKFDHIRRIPGLENTLTNNYIHNLTVDQANRLWIATKYGLNLYNPDSKNITTYVGMNDDPTTLKGNRIMSVYASKSGKIYVSSYGNGISKLEQETNSFIHYNDSCDFPVKSIHNITEDSHGILWCGTNGEGLVRFNPQTYECDVFTADSNKWLKGMGKSVSFIYVDDNDLVFISTSSLQIINFKSKEVQTYREGESEFKARKVNGIVKDENNIYWLATNKGLAKFNYNDKSFLFYGRDNGFLNTDIQGILKDEQGNLWLTSKNGMDKFNTHTEELIAHYDKIDGLQDNEFLPKSAIKGKDGALYFGGVNGITAFYPNQINNNYSKPKMLLTNIKLFNDYLKVGPKSILKKDIKHQKEIILKHNENVITIEYVGLSYISPEQNTYKYIMEGFEKQWQEVGKSRSAIYTNLSPGDYTFKVLGANNDGHWADVPASINITIKPPFWKTIVAYIIYVLLVSSVVYSYTRWRRIRTERDKRILEEKIKQGEKQIETQRIEVEKQREEIVKRDEEEREIRFLNAGMAHFGEIIGRERKKLFKLTQNVIAELVNYVGANSGAIFIVTEDNNEQQLKLMGSFAFATPDGMDVVKKGEGYIGTCFSDNKTITISNAPDGYIKLESGLGETKLNNLIFVPIRTEDAVMGVLEVASIEPLEQYKIKFIEKIGETIGSTLAVVRANKKSREMLEENRVQSEELLAQEEEMRQNIEELQATQELAQRKELTLTKELDEKNELIKSLKEELKSLREQISEDTALE
ncbi:MAG: GAF domain-containing protein [Bacteroidales bacterium]|nr:GAF domain-containing protein [Bacteroidales bacterium]